MQVFLENAEAAIPPINEGWAAITGPVLALLCLYGLIKKTRTRYRLHFRGLGGLRSGIRDVLFSCPNGASPT